MPAETFTITLDLLGGFVILYIGPMPLPTVKIDDRNNRIQYTTAAFFILMFGIVFRYFFPFTVLATVTIAFLAVET